jgi:hypothetical protein
VPRTSAYSEAPYQGVSQAPAQVRLPTQAEVLTNFSVSVPSGASKRAPFEWLANLVGPTTTSIASSYISKAGGDFLLATSAASGVTTPRLYNIDDLPSPSSGALAPVAVTISPAAQAYLNSGAPNPSTDLVQLTVEDYTFILNRKVTVANGVTTAATRPFEAMLWVRQAAYARTYEVKVVYGATTLIVTLKTPNGKDATDAPDVDTDIIAAGLFGTTYPTGITSAANGASVVNNLGSLTGAGFTVLLQGGVIYLSHPSVDFTLEVKDGQGGNGLLAVKDQVQAFSDLPKKAPVEGFTIRISQQSGTDEDDFFMKWTETAGIGTGIWQETIAPGANLGIDPNTLPVGLIYNRTLATWSLEVLDWEGRTVGDESLVPDPGFVGETLRDITFHRGRLVLVYGEGARVSSSTDPLRLYASTLSQTLADDAFEIINPLEGQAEFEHAVAFKKVLILWGRKGQAQVQSGGQPLTSLTVVTEPYSQYEVSPTVRPQQSNDRLYFAAPRGKSSSAVYEMEVRGSSSDGSAEGDDMSVSVPRYIPSGVNQAATCLVNYLTVYGVTGSTELTPHLYRYVERQRAQNAWSRWELPEGCTYAGGFFVNTGFYALVLRGGVIHLLWMDTADGTLDVGSTFTTKLDFRITDQQATLVYDPDGDTTLVTLPYTMASGAYPTVVVSPTGGLAGPLIGDTPLTVFPGEEAEILDWEGSSGVLVGDWTQVPLLIGEDYTARWRLSPIYYRDDDGRVDRTGRLVLRNIIFDMDRTALAKVNVTIGGRTTLTHTFESPLFDTPSADYDQVNLYSGPWTVPLGGSSEETMIEVVLDSWAPANFLGYTWAGEINPKAMRMRG